MLTTIHIINSENSRIKREWRKSCETSTDSNKIKSVFGSNIQKILLILAVIDDYN